MTRSRSEADSPDTGLTDRCDGDILAITEFHMQSSIAACIRPSPRTRSWFTRRRLLRRDVAAGVAPAGATMKRRNEVELHDPCAAETPTWTDADIEAAMDDLQAPLDPPRLHDITDLTERPNDIYLAHVMGRRRHRFFPGNASPTSCSTTSSTGAARSSTRGMRSTPSCLRWTTIPSMSTVRAGGPSVLSRATWRRVSHSSQNSRASMTPSWRWSSPTRPPRWLTVASTLTASTRGIRRTSR